MGSLVPTGLPCESGRCVAIITPVHTLLFTRSSGARETNPRLQIYAQPHNRAVSHLPLVHAGAGELGEQAEVGDVLQRAVLLGGEHETRSGVTFSQSLPHGDALASPQRTSHPHTHLHAGSANGFSS